MRIRMALQHPRLRGSEAFRHFASTVDIAPTLWALAGLPPSPDFHGRDLSPLLLNDRGERPESIYAEGRINLPDEWRMVVRGLDKLVVRPSLEVLHLYNLGEDPDEMRNLAREIGYQLRVDELTALVKSWMKRTRDGMEPSGLRRR
jgi:arylsulfatase A-like enzyme